MRLEVKCILRRHFSFKTLFLPYICIYAFILSTFYYPICNILHELKKYDPIILHFYLNSAHRNTYQEFLIAVVTMSLHEPIASRFSICTQDLLNNNLGASISSAALSILYDVGYLSLSVLHCLN